MTLNIALTTVLRTNVLHCDWFVQCMYVYDFGCRDWLVYLIRIYLMTILRCFPGLENARLENAGPENRYALHVVFILAYISRLKSPAYRKLNSLLKM